MGLICKGTCGTGAWLFPGSVSSVCWIVGFLNGPRFLCSSPIGLAPILGMGGTDIHTKGVLCKGGIILSIGWLMCFVYWDSLNMWPLVLPEEYPFCCSLLARARCLSSSLWVFFSDFSWNWFALVSLLSIGLSASLLLYLPSNWAWIQLKSICIVLLQTFCLLGNEFLQLLLVVCSPEFHFLCPSLHAIVLPTYPCCLGMLVYWSSHCLLVGLYCVGSILFVLYC